MNELIKAVRKHALDHYEEDGWDIVVEAWSDNDIVEHLDGVTDPHKAIEVIGDIVAGIAEYANDIRATAF